MSVRDNVQRSIAMLAASEPSNSAFAAKCGVSRSRVEYWLSGNGCPDVDMVGIIADVYNLPLSWFFENHDERIERYVVPFGDATVMMEYWQQLNDEGRAFLLKCAQTAVASGLYR